MHVARSTNLSGGVASRPASEAFWAPYAELTKPRLIALVLVTTALGFVLAPGGVAWGTLCAVVAGTGLLGGGGNGLNQWIEVAQDARMRRTDGRPLPSRRLSRPAAATFSLAIIAVGAVLLATLVNPLTAGLGVLSAAVYVLVYTPLKRRTALNTLVGAVSGAIPPMMGWTAATGEVGAGAWVLFAILFIWQIPHFLAIAVLYRADYARGGFRMLPVQDVEGHLTGRVALVYCLGLVPVTLAAVLVGIAGWFYVAGATALGLFMIVAGWRLHRRGTPEAARLLFRTSLAYLPALFLLMVLDPTRLLQAPFF